MPACALSHGRLPVWMSPWSPPSSAPSRAGRSQVNPASSRTSPPRSFPSLPSPPPLSLPRGAPLCQPLLGEAESGSLTPALSPHPEIWS